MIINFLLLLTSVVTQPLPDPNPPTLTLTIYNENFAIVKDTRTLTIEPGESTLYFTDVAQNIMTQTVTFKALGNSQAVRVVEQNFQRNLVERDGVLRKVLGEEVEVVGEFGNQPKRVSGILLAYNPDIILKTQTGLIIPTKISAIDLPTLPSTLFTKPTLNWKISNTSPSPLTSQCQVAYRTSGFQWKADYIIVINQQETISDIAGWVTIDNDSGKRYEDAKLKLIAGDVNVKRGGNFTMTMNEVGVKRKGGDGEGFSQKAFGDYHMYTLDRLVTLSESSQKQIQFLPKIYKVPIHKYTQIQLTSNSPTTPNLPILSKITLNNTNQSNLGLPLPKGTFRVFKQDQQDNSLQFIGEDSIDHTPKNQNITLKIGRAFDVRADLVVENRTEYVGGDGMRSGGYRAVMNLTVVNRGEKVTEVEVRYENEYGGNLGITWLGDGGVNLQRVSAQEYKLVKSMAANEKVSYRWVEDYQP